MKVCSQCKENKLLEDFGKNKKSLDGLYHKCKICKNIYDNNFYKNRPKSTKETKYKNQVLRLNKIRQYFIEYFKDKKCSNCSENRMPALDFHHLKDKKFNISNAISNGYSINLIKKEIDKCIILCANCHRVETAIELNWYKIGS